MINKIKSWAIVVNYSDGDEDVKYITDLPNNISQQIDDYMTELEEKGDVNNPINWKGNK
tara:strand:- start:385 stop:561 length:177 start_codon:yes stop_codon:yes gene_type:complete